MVEYDSPWKDALDEYLPAFMELFFPAAQREIDWTRGYEILDTELQQIVRDAELGMRRVDRLFKVWRTSGEEAWILIHIEIQNQRDTGLPKRMFVYHYRIFDKFDREPVSLAILGDENPTWRPDRFAYNNWGCELGFAYPVVKLLDYRAREAELEASENPFAIVLLAHLKSQETRGDAESRRAWKFRLVRALYQRGYDGRKIRRLFSFIDWVLELPKPLELEFWNDVQTLEGEKKMEYVLSIERFAMEKGLQKGLEQGRATGVREGLLEGIEGLLEVKFGAEGLALLPKIRELDDVPRLRVVFQAIKTAVTIDEVREELKS
jgi:hypothetical protein